jgi:hypothetical protein
VTKRSCFPILTTWAVRKQPDNFPSSSCLSTSNPQPARSPIGEFYKNIVRMQRHININQANKTFGFDLTSNIGRYGSARWWHTTRLLPRLTSCSRHFCFSHHTNPSLLPRASRLPCCAGQSLISKLLPWHSRSRGNVPYSVRHRPGTRHLTVHSHEE